MSSDALHPSIVLSAYLEALVRGKRVASLGDATNGLAEALADRGARLVHAYDPKPARVAEALAKRAADKAASVSYAVFEGDLGVRDGAFDVVVIADLGDLGDRAEAVRRARRLVGPTGCAVIASPNGAVTKPLVGPNRTGGTPTYYELYDLVSLQFPRVKMIGVAPFVGYTVADFAPDEEPEVSVDTSLLAGSEEPEVFLAIASERPVVVDPYAIVELPIDEIDLGDASAADQSRAALDEARAKIASLAAELEAVREKELHTSKRAAEAVTLSARVVELEGEVEKTRARFKEVETRAGDAHVRAERAGHTVRDLEEELVRQRDRSTKLSKSLDDEKRARQKAEIELGMLRGTAATGDKQKVEQLERELEQTRTRVSELELENAATMRRQALASVIPPPPDSERSDTLRPPPPSTSLDARIAELEVALEEAERAAKSASADRQRELGSERRAQGARIAELEAALDAANARVRQIESRLAVSVEGTIEQDVSKLEAALRERGHVVQKLERDLREAERIGRELVGELPIENDVGGVNGGGGLGGDEDESRALRRQLDTLASTAARVQADLQASTWRVAQLERELADAAATREPATVHNELERALAASQDEVASLRRKLGRGELNANGG